MLRGQGVSRHLKAALCLTGNHDQNDCKSIVCTVLCAPSKGQDQTPAVVLASTGCFLYSIDTTFQTASFSVKHSIDELELVESQSTTRVILREQVHEGSALWQ